MISPRNPGMNGNSEVTHDDRSDAAHKQEVDKAGGQNTSGADEKKND